MARVVRVHAFGGPELLSVDEIDVREPGSGEVRMNVNAIGLNRAETMMMRGFFGEIPLPSLIGYEAAGQIESVGADVTGFSVGDRVATLPGMPMNYGACGEQILAPAEMLVKTPSALSDEEAAGSWMAYLTAYAIKHYRPLQPGQAVLITAASSSVGLAAIQIARAEGAVPIAATRGPAKIEALKQHGAAHVIASENRDIAAAVQEITEGRGAALAFDAVAGPGFPSILSSLCLGGMAIVYGGLGGEPSQFSASALAFQDITIRGYATNFLVADPNARREAIAYVSEGVSNGKFRPVIDRAFSLDEIGNAYSYLESNEQIGKIIVRP